MGGEKPIVIPCSLASRGSPPRGRGKAAAGLRSPRSLGITPTHAGKRTRSWRAYGCPWDHPRAGGEKWFWTSIPSGLVGAPPRRRGKVGLDGGLSEAVGITPAQAGKSKLALCTPSCPTDHPRACGEKNKELEGVWLPMGSPPHGRGKVMKANKKVKENGITPAWAGKSRECRYALTNEWDHPRVGGEKGQACPCTRKPQGSPPHGRGKAPHAVSCASWVWITPAWAGKRVRKPSCWLSVEDHPRVGGEKFLSFGGVWGVGGSPPRRRGKAHLLAAQPLYLRITPA